MYIYIYILIPPYIYIYMYILINPFYLHINLLTVKDCHTCCM